MPPIGVSATTPAQPIEQIECYFNHQWQQIPVYQREQLCIGQEITGPAMILETTGTLLLNPNWQATLHADGQIEMIHQKQRNQSLDVPNDFDTPDPIELGLFNHRFMAIAEQMGTILAKSAQSVNIKERLDFSCALFDIEGQLIANAPHVPVHLGSMGESVRTVRQRYADQLNEGDSFAINNPFAGGTHLPDITLVSPVFIDSELAFFVASRGHHADVGGLTPGSMPAHSQSIDEEGVLFDCMPITKKGQFLEASVRAALNPTLHPARNIQQNINDLMAQIAANQTGIEQLQQLCSNVGVTKVNAYMQHLLKHSERAIQSVLPHLQSGSFCYDTDQGTQVCVTITIDAEQARATIDFTGTSAQQANNFNAPLAITRAATLYVLRTLIQEPIALNDGFLRPVELIVPKGCMLNPCAPAAVVAGNVETSQVVTDALYGALQVQAASQGTMNNLTFGDANWQYYETIAGGSGAGQGYAGSSCVHTHMTNSRLTDPEIFEQRYPVRLKEFAIRRKSGGQGLWRGGDGLIRQIEFLSPMTVSILSNHRIVPPYGMAGGQEGECGRHGILRAQSSQIEWLPSTFTQAFQRHEQLRIETPGGGGFGRTPHCDP